MKKYRYYFHQKLEEQPQAGKNTTVFEFGFADPSQEEQFFSKIGKRREDVTAANVMSFLAHYPLSMGTHAGNLSAPKRFGEYHKDIQRLLSKIIADNKGIVMKAIREWNQNYLDLEYDPSTKLLTITSDDGTDRRNIPGGKYGV